MNQLQQKQYTGKGGIYQQLTLPISENILIDEHEPVYVANAQLEELDYTKLYQAYSSKGRKSAAEPRIMFKLLVYGYMCGIYSTRKLELACRKNIDFIWLLQGEKVPDYSSFARFRSGKAKEAVEELFYQFVQRLAELEETEYEEVFIDGTKIESMANRYTFVWKTGVEKNLAKLKEKAKVVFNECGGKGNLTRKKLRELADKQLPPNAEFVHGIGKRKSEWQKRYEKLDSLWTKWTDYEDKLFTIGNNRRSMSKTDKDATFMRMKKDYMGNDQLLPAYNIQIGVADEYIAVADVNHYRSDMDCFVPLMEKFHDLYGFYPEYPVADAGYGSYSNYLYCEAHGMKKYMKFTMFDKESKDRKYRENPYRSENFQIDPDGVMHCPNGKAFHFRYRKNVKGNKYGRQEEVFECEDCSGCPYASECKKTPKNRTVRINQELTAMHREVLDNLNSIHGALLRMNRSIQAEGTFGVMKYDRRYRRIVRRGLNSVRLEVFLVSIGHNLYKLCNKTMKKQNVA